MYEELIKSLRLCREILHEDDSCIEFVDGSCEAFPICAYQLMEKAADAIEVLSKKEKTTQWISVTERLPEKHEWVLVKSKFVKMKTDFISNAGHWYTTPAVTHWMPLPEPPKVET